MLLNKWLTLVGIKKLVIKKNQNKFWFFIFEKCFSELLSEVC